MAFFQRSSIETRLPAYKGLLNQQRSEQFLASNLWNKVKKSFPQGKGNV